MRFRFSSILLSLCVLVSAAGNLFAEMRLTDVSGREVTISRGTVKPLVRGVSTRKAGSHAEAIVNVTAGADTDAANNDFRRIQNAINAAGNGDTIILSGIFDFTQPFAVAAWALGSDNTAATADDYCVYVPANLNGVTLTATSLGSATIQGPGDLAAINLEGFLVFDGGDNQNWTISNLRVLDFDLGIAMFSGAGGGDAFNNAKIQNNFIRLPIDLNATVAPADVNQNIAIHFAVGTNQLIDGNTIQLPGNGVSDGANLSSIVAMQSNTSGGAFYDGLAITNNIVHVLLAQSANPQRTLGIWENGHAHLSNITVSGNSFLSQAAGNDPALNNSSAFRVTSHSGAATLVTYDSNVVQGANGGIVWITGSNFTGNQAVVVTNNQITDSATGIVVQSNGIAHVRENVITQSGSGGGIHVVTGTLTGPGANPNGLYHTTVSHGTGDGIWIEATAGAIAPIIENNLGTNTGFGLRNETAASIVAERNWWGNNLAAQVAAKVSGSADFDPWLASGTDIDGAAFAFQPFLYATTSGTLTTFVGTAGADTGALLAGSRVTMTVSGQTAFTALAQLLNFDIQPGASDDLFTLGQTGVPTVFDGGAGNDTLIGTNVAQSWNITGANSGNIPGAATSFASVEALRGGTAADAFVFGAAGTVALTVDGNLGIDTLNNNAIVGAVRTPTGPGSLDGFTGTATGVGTTFNNINLVAGLTADVTMTASGPATAVTGGPLVNIFPVTNNGPDTATGVVVSGTLPAGLTFVSATPSQGICSGTTTITCNIGTLANGASATITVAATVTASGGSVSNTSTVTSTTIDPTSSNDSATATTALAAALAIPALGEWGLLVLAAMLGMVAVWKVKA